MPASRAILFDIDSRGLSHKSSHTRSALNSAVRNGTCHVESAEPVEEAEQPLEKDSYVEMIAPVAANDDITLELPKKKRTARKQQMAT